MLRVWMADPSVIVPTPVGLNTAASNPFAQLVYVVQLGLLAPFIHVNGPPAFDQTLSPAPARPPTNGPKSTIATSSRRIAMGDLRSASPGDPPRASKKLS